MTNRTVAELRTIAASLNLKVPSRILKADLLAMIARAEAARPAARPKFCLVGKIAPSVRAHGETKVSSFLLRSHGQPNLYVSMSTITWDRLRARIESGNIDIRRPVQVMGYFFAAKGVDRHGQPHPDGFHITSIRRADPQHLRNPAQHVMQVDAVAA